MIEQLTRLDKSIIVIDDNTLAGRVLCALLTDQLTSRVLGPLPSKERRWRDADASVLFLIDKGGLVVSVGKLIRQIRIRHPAARVVVVGTTSAAELSVLFALGISTFVSYSDVDNLLAKALRFASLGRRGWIRVGRMEAPTPISEVSVSRAQVLSPRQRQILKLLRQDLSDKDIASRLSISPNTIKFHLQTLFQKTCVHDRRSLAAMFTDLEFPRSERASSTALLEPEIRGRCDRPTARVHYGQMAAC